MNCLRRCADACCRASFFFLLFSFLLLFRTVFCFCFLVQNYLRQQPLKSLHLVNVLDLFHAAYTYSTVCLCVCVCSYKSLYVFVSLVFNTFIALCVFFSSSVRSLSLSLSRSFAIFALKKPNTFCVLFCYYYLCVSVED